MKQKTKKELLRAPIITETSTEEERTAASDFKKRRFTVLIMESVFLGLMLLALLFSLFIPCMKREVKNRYDTNYSLTLSVADEVFSYFSMGSALKADIDSFTKNGGVQLINTDNDKEHYKSASEEQILADVAYKKTCSFSKLKAQFDVESFISGVNYNINQNAKEIRKYFPEDKANELIGEYVKEQRSAVGAVFDLFSYEIERNNYAGLGRFLYTVEIDLSETSFRQAAEKFLLGKYEWNEEFKTTLNTAVKAAHVIPELQDEFYYVSGDLTRFADGTNYGFQLIFSIIILAIDILLLILLILGGISLYKQFRRSDVSLKSPRETLFLLICALLHLIMPLIIKDALFAGAFCAGTIVNALFLIFAVVLQIIYTKYLTKMKTRLNGEE